MEEMIAQYSNQIIIFLTVGVIILLILNIISQIRISSITKKYNRLVEGVDKDSLEDLIFEYIEEVKDMKKEAEVIKDMYEKLNNKLKFAVQRVGFVRYNAFNDVGSDLSFSIALLDDNLNGFVISSLFGRNECNTYAKPIFNGESKYALSDEEIQAIKMAKEYGVSSKLGNI
ncbi:DUF4446 family protein [Caloranaerobacter azorensis]|uniref:DUF4446 domain-containing protein n=2 Tax=Caloranaerobacter azorensis TaxID=116090 RepID=A0A1M5VPD4_9FIRM|nr:DUF4446 family protein [Caloranaerobacter azorensis]QIB27877.1 DUF4446 family protein [Caloranaerobacter azorensis]SHH77116.1 Protein of unknown function [Caloranaerobacter azorensis DSM 13643]